MRYANIIEIGTRVFVAFALMVVTVGCSRIEHESIEAFALIACGVVIGQAVRVFWLEPSRTSQRRVVTPYRAVPRRVS